MTTASLATRVSSGGAVLDVSTVIDAVGRASFFSDLLRFLNQVCGAEHCAIYRLTQDELSEVGGGSLDGSQTAQERITHYLSRQYWRRDPGMSELHRSSREAGQSIIRADLGQLSSDCRSQIFPHIRDRVMICGHRCQFSYCLSLLRSDRSGPFTGGDLERLGRVEDAIVSAIAKHAEMLSRGPHMALASLTEIESCILGDGRLPRREAEVCARVLYGLSSAGIALDLGIGEETVKTYRIRAYQRLAVGSPRELLMWYLELWSPWAEHALPPMPRSTLAS